MLKFARFILGVTFKMASNYVREEIRAAVREEVSQMLGSSRTERKVGEGISPSTSLVNPFLSLFLLCLFLSKMREFCHNRQAFQFIDVQVFG